MADENNSQEEVILSYIIGSNSIDWLSENISKYSEVCDKIRQNSTYIDGWITTRPAKPEILVQIRGSAGALEDALEKLFNSEFGLPYAVRRPASNRESKEGFRIAEKIIHKYGKKLKTVLDGAFIQKVVV